MLIRLVDHFRDNPKRIDKLIAVKGLPDEWFFRESPEGKELKKPWEPDVDKNIPFDIRGFCDPTYVIIRYSPIHKDAQGVIEKRQILGVRIDYNSEPGRQMWDDVERYIEESMPRNERIPVPVVCAKDERSSFETFTPRRTARGSLEMIPSPVPLVDLTKYVAVKMEEKAPDPSLISDAPREPLIPPAPPSSQCQECGRTFQNEHGLRIHLMRPKNHKEKIGV